MNVNIFQWRSLKTRVTLFTLAIFVIGIWSLAFYASRMLREDMQLLLGEQQFSTVSFVAAGVNQELDDRLRVLAIVAGRVTLATLGNTAALQAFLDERLILQELFNGGVIAYRLDGTAIAEVPLSAGRIGVNYMDRDHVAAALKEGKATIGRPVTGSKLRAPIFGMTVPIRDTQGKVIGALSGVIDLATPNFLDKISENRYGRTGGYLLIAPQYRLIVTASGKSRIMEVLPAPGINPAIDRFLQGYEGSAVYVNSLGVEVLASVKGVPVAGWLVPAILPTAEAFAPIHDMQRRMLLATIFLTLLAGGLTWWMLRRQLAPMFATVKTLATLSDTNQHPQSLPNTRQDEIGELIGGFNRLLETLGKRQEALSESESRSRAIIEASPVPLAMNDEHGNITLLNKAFVQAVGYTVNDIPTLADWWPRAYPDPQYRQWVADNWQKHLEEAKRTGRPFAPMETNIRCKDDSVRTFMSSATAVEEKFAGTYLVILYDITERKRAEAALREQEEFFRLIAENIGDFIAVLDLDGRRLYNSPSYRRLFGGARDLHGTDSFAEIHPEDQQRVKQVFGETVQSGIGHQIEYRFALEGGDIRRMESRGGVIRDEQGRVARVLVVSRDITERKQMEDRVRQLAFHDTLTKLPNRRLLNDRLSQTMAASKRSGRYGALMFLDLDNFKLLNDTHGHEVGDLLLIEAADRLKSCVREMDTVARFGGDEFVVMISELDADKTGSTTQAGIIAEKIRAALAKPYELKIQHEGKAETTVEHHCTASIGVALFIKDEASQDNILKWADMAMYQAKEAGCNLARFYDSKA